MDTLQFDSLIALAKTNGRLEEQNRILGAFKDLVTREAIGGTLPIEFASKVAGIIDPSTEF